MEIDFSGDNLTVALALSYAIAAIEKLPAAWREDGEAQELKAWRALMKRIVPEEVAAEWIKLARAVLDGREKPFERPKLT